MNPLTQLVDHALALLLSARGEGDVDDLVDEHEARELHAMGPGEQFDANLDEFGDWGANL